MKNRSWPAELRGWSSLIAALTGRGPPLVLRVFSPLAEKVHPVRAEVKSCATVWHTQPKGD